MVLAAQDQGMFASSGRGAKHQIAFDRGLFRRVTPFPIAEVGLGPAGCGHAPSVLHLLAVASGRVIKDGLFIMVRITTPRRMNS
jgi:hypothetical protein